MKGQIAARLRAPARLSAGDWLLLAIPALGWYGAFLSRPAVMHLVCAESPTHCIASRVFFLDRFAIGRESARADLLSFVTQDAIGVLAVLIPLAWALRRRRFRAAAIDFTLFLETACWTGLVTESARILVQRPRPFVYTDPGRLGVDAAHYTSFLSGHSSFSAAAGMALVLALWGHRASRAWMLPSVLLAVSLPLLTGAFRVLSGRHFPTDVIAAWCAGGGVAFTLAWMHRR